AEVRDALPVPITGVVSDGQAPIQAAVRAVVPGVPHQLCQCHYLREAAKPLFEADRHAKKELKKQIRGVRPLERALEGRDDEEARAIRGYCVAVRAAYQALLATMMAEQAAAGRLRGAVGHFLKVTASYGDGLLHCYEVPDLPRTNNDLERRCGTLRYHERRATGRRSIPGGAV